MKVRCIKEIEEGYTKRDCIVGNVYEVIIKTGGTYDLIDESGDSWFYSDEFFEEVIEEVEEGKYYWVKCTEKDDFEPAKATYQYNGRDLYFRFLNGSVKEAKYAFASEPLEYKK